MVKIMKDLSNIYKFDMGNNIFQVWSINTVKYFYFLTFLHAEKTENIAEKMTLIEYFNCAWSIYVYFVVLSF